MPWKRTRRSILLDVATRDTTRNRERNALSATYSLIQKFLIRGFIANDLFL